ncbi:hypothetical protein Q31b_30320 [Novipirellula aureliae]|uniref:Uncharacterized protein n=1 Tax=Novipirellula aureliae TaxID=2527966 RepID=A0A5C6E1P9_9BACT|nr:DUF6580 family putative transport protein [Novipirellula aureliae]TWU41581.1 hypothetical protein Q31b_30320 [Novipirellula aureliae]
MFDKRTLLIGSLVLVAVASRLLPHPPNFTALGAVALFGGASLTGRRWAYGLPLLAMLLSDLVIGFHGWAPVVYGAMMVYVWLGRRAGSSSTRVIGASLLGSVAFFVITNLACWWSMYDHSAVGLTACFAAAIPFFGFTLAGDLVFSGVLFGAMAMAEKLSPSRFAPSLSLGC